MARQSRLKRVLNVEGLEGRTLAAADLSAMPEAVRGIGHHGHRHQLGSISGTNLTLPTLGGVRTLPNIEYTTLGGPQHLDLYLPTTPPPPGGYPAILALPGGGWRWVRRSDLGNTVGALAQDGYVVAVADYAYAGSSPGGPGVWPTNFEDVEQAVRWLRDNSKRFGIDTTKIAAWGESAGGHLAALLGTDAQGAQSPDASPGTPKTEVSAQVQAVIDFYGPTDLTSLYNENPRSHSYLETFLGGTPTTVPDRYTAASPLTHVSPGDPPFFVLQGTADLANLSDQSDRLVAALRASGVPTRYDVFNGVPHGFRLRLGTNVNLLPEVLTFLDQALNHSGKGVDNAG